MLPQLGGELEHAQCDGASDGLAQRGMLGDQPRRAHPGRQRIDHLNQRRADNDADSVAGVPSLAGLLKIGDKLHDLGHVQ